VITLLPVVAVTVLPVPPVIVLVVAAVMVLPDPCRVLTLPDASCHILLLISFDWLKKYFFRKKHR